jgi:Xaa-Pro aminopeptidase
MQGTTGPDWSARHRRLASTLKARSLDALVVSTRANVRYLCGFGGSSGLLVAAPDRRWLLVDGRYAQEAREELASRAVPGTDIERIDEATADALSAIVARIGLRRVGFEARDVTVATIESWREGAPSVEWIRTDGAIEEQRAVKDAFEQAVFRRAGSKLSDVARILCSLVKIQSSEIEVARAIDRALESAGFSGPAFPTIVASGPNSARPHARPTDRRLAAGDLVVLDFGGVLDGYCVDLSRTASVGNPSSEARRLYETVREAQSAALAAIRPGESGAAVDAAARGVLARAGLAETFLHATGHGLGLEVHEAPRLGRASGRTAPSVLAEGMVCTVEPGAYVGGFGGVRIEDDVLVTGSGCEALTDAPRDLLVV